MDLMKVNKVADLVLGCWLMVAICLLGTDNLGFPNGRCGKLVHFLKDTDMVRCGWHGGVGRGVLCTRMVSVVGEEGRLAG